MSGRILRWLLPLYVFLLPWQARYILAEYSLTAPFYGDKSLYVTDGLFFVLVLVWIIWLRKEKDSLRSFVANSSVRRIIYSLALIFAWLGLTLLWSPNLHIAYEKWFRLSQAILLFFIMLHNPLSRSRLLVAFLASASVQSIVAVVQFLQQGIAPSTWLGMSGQYPQDLGVSVVEFGNERWLRAYGTLPHPNMLGGFLSLAALIALAAYIRNAVSMVPWYGKWESMQKPQMQSFRYADLGNFIAFLFCFIGLLLTFSRSSWLGFLAGSAIIVVFSLWKHEALARKAVMWAAGKLALVAIVLFVFLNAVFGNLWISRAHDQSRLGQVSVIERRQLQEDAKQIISQHPFRGVGLGGYLPTLIQNEGNRLSDSRPIYRFQPVHNTWLLLWAELGLVGSLLFLIWVLGTFSALRKKRIVTAAILFAVGLMFYFDHFWFSLPFGMFLAAVALSLPERELTTSEK